MEINGRLISKGKICSVYLIEDADNGLKRIVKIYGKESYEYFCIEKEILQKYRIINFPDLINSYFENERYHLVVEYIQGKTISEKVAEKGAMDRDEAVSVLKLVIEAILRFYSVTGGKYVFCDLSPANIIIRDDKEISIIDLNSISRKGEGFKTATFGFTDDSGFRSECTGDKTDIYSAGKLYCFMLTGRTDADAIKDMGRKNAEIVSRCTVTRDMGSFGELLAELGDGRREKYTRVLFKRKICIAGDGEFALELAYSLKNMGYRVSLDNCREQSQIIRYFHKYNNGEEIMNDRGADIEISCVRDTGDIKDIKYHKIFRTIKALTHEIEEV